MNSLPTRSDRFDRIGLWILAASVLTPLLVSWTDFAALFWLGDEWDQWDQMEKFGFWPWTFGFFGENFSPLFKLVWGGTARLGGGGYFSLVILVWLVHASAVGLMGRWMRLAGFGRLATTVAILGFGLAACNVETLTWTVQLITVQGIGFFLAAGCWWMARETNENWDLRSRLIFCALVTASTFSFARGALTGVALAAATLMATTGTEKKSRNWSATIRLLGLCLVPAMALTGLMAGFAPGNHHRLAAAGIEAPVQYATWYFLLNPFHRFFDISTWGPHTTLVLGAIKVAVLAAGWRLAKPRQRGLLAAVLAFDLGSAVLLGIGRYHTGLTTTISSRYQYISLLGTMPFAGLCSEALLRTLIPRVEFRFLAAAGLVAGLAVHTLGAWPSQVQAWANDSRRVRQLLSPAAYSVPEGAITGLEWISNQRAKDLVEKYHLH